MLSTIVGEVNGRAWVHPQQAKGSVLAAFSCRVGGDSTGPFASLNVGLHVGDDPLQVIRSREQCAAYCGVPLEHFVFAEQVHGSAVAVVTHEHAGRGARNLATAIPGVDALVTNQSGLALAILVADCVPILMWDEARHVVAAIHSGWRGTVLHLAAKTVDVMKEQFGTHPSDVRVALGPSIRRCCYEVDDAVLDKVKSEFSPLVVSPSARPKHAYLSLVDCIREDLDKSGVLPDHVEDVGICTSCHHNLFFSYRKEGRTGRSLAVVCLK
ncbi:MAG: peptidoglycan editing factor PgeF [Alicyclobacillaceae bacterium]|uniref:peptidoglycan editing factor PgeF n=1 Tax=Alicyclobacillus sp. SP_1 TaxID=2942475 RepID=UPI0021584DB2|nr:peptidoglycan editing factor PgeF [Alicyclobacillus sp. SP_1]MCY0886959.1 peptidoglycan editing factor PgeF [Alicyclobacillaceae bacterium]MCY0897205.1 peptidoglycan editing factor PgeF [Alicyclobacillaceae bacterium]